MRYGRAKLCALGSLQLVFSLVMQGESSQAVGDDGLISVNGFCFAQEGTKEVKTEFRDNGYAMNGIQ